MHSLQEHVRCLSLLTPAQRIHIFPDFFLAYLLCFIDSFNHSIGRHSKSLDTQRFICALCKGYFVLMTPSKPRALTVFASFVKENYGNVKQEMAGQSHAEVMRKLSADFASKTKLSQS